jgi:hypothetical protein
MGGTKHLRKNRGKNQEKGGRKELAKRRRDTFSILLRNRLELHLELVRLLKRESKVVSILY